MKKIQVLQLLAVVLPLVAAAQTPAPGIATPPSPQRGSSESVDLKVVKVFSAKDGDAVFRAYLVEWKGQEVVVDDRLVKTEYQVGETVTILVFRLPYPNGKPGPDLLHFDILPRKRAEPFAPANGASPRR